MTRPSRSARTSPTPSPADPSVEALLAAFERCATAEERAQTGVRLAVSGLRDERIRAALVRMLEDDPPNASAYLTAYGDRRSVSDLSRAFDRLVASPIGDCPICQAQHLLAIQTAVKLLGGSLTGAQLLAIEEAMEEAAAAWVPLDTSCSLDDLPPPFGCEGRRRPGRNDPCPCGSGKKYKRCCLGAAPERATH